MTGLLAGLAVAILIPAAAWVTGPLLMEDPWVCRVVCRVLGHRFVYTWAAYAVLHRCARCGARHR